MNDFLRGYYGEAADPYVREYIELWQQAARPWHVNLFESVDSPFISDEVIRKATALIGEARWRTKDPTQHKRLDKLMLSMNYLTIERMPASPKSTSAGHCRIHWSRCIRPGAANRCVPLPTTIKCNRRDEL